LPPARSASLEEFAAAGGMAVLRARSLVLTRLLELLITTDGQLSSAVGIITPPDPSARGCQLSLVFHAGGVRRVSTLLSREGVVVDVREPAVIRVAPAPLYNNAADVSEFVRVLKAVLREIAKEDAAAATAATLQAAAAGPDGLAIEPEP
jgi:kynureninase